MTERKKNLPVFSVTTGNDKMIYQRIGTAFENSSGFNVLLNSAPLSGRLWIKTKEKDWRTDPKEDQGSLE